ncbi:FliA/WhiG family RNA polymerase sigma factor [Sanguibacter sp. A247]|uniref:FliA/WhiG family RNA polymerase sigma factor n=1 Tax=unclassified Sanguibacter TaxID=2645534 RepID=UPI003FD8895B
MTESVLIDLEADLAPRDAVAEIWIEYKHSGSTQRREELILHYAPLVSMVASRIAMRLPSSVEHADLVSYGMFGLIDAIEKFEIDREIKFETYASARIRGAIIDELRQIDWVPRSVRSKSRAIDRAHAELESQWHRRPTDDEVAAHLDVPVVDVRAVHTQVSRANIVALDELLAVGAERAEPISVLDTSVQGHSDDPARSFEAKESRYLLGRALCQLTDREKLVLTLYYFQNRTLAEIGAILGVTESRISQVHSAAVIRLRQLLDDVERG